MSKFVIQCPHCGTYNSASTSFFAKNMIECQCGKIINVKRDRMTSTECPHCKNIVVYDQAKGKHATCPICKEKLVTNESLNKTADIKCPSCACELTVDKNGDKYICPLCETEINIQEQLKKQEVKNGTVSVIKFEADNKTFVWKHPIEDFNMGSQLIVHESQEAIFFRDGKALDSFEAGRYTLSTANIPLLNDLYKLPTNGENMFHSEVYFINLTTQMGIKWGTDSKIRMFDPMSGMHLELGACGSFNVQVNNGRKLLLKIVGTTNKFSQNELVGSDYSTSGMLAKFKGLIISKVKTFLAKTIKDNNVNILEVDEYIDVISKVLKDKINEVLDDYGLYMPEFFVTTILTPDDDPNFKRMKEQYAERYLKVQQERILQAEAEAAQARRVVEAQTMAQEEIIAAQAQAEAYRLQAEAEAKEMQMKGYTYQQETQRQVATAAVSNMPNGGAGVGGNDMSNMLGGMVNLGVGLGVMGEVVGTVKNAVNPIVGQATSMGQSISTAMNEKQWICPTCGQSATSNFCPNCGTKKVELKPQTELWNCSCGLHNITTPFCPNCGTKKPVIEETNAETWDCECGKTGNVTPFCPNCGSKKGE